MRREILAVKWNESNFMYLQFLSIEHRWLAELLASTRVDSWILQEKWLTEKTFYEWWKMSSIIVVEEAEKSVKQKYRFWVSSYLTPFQTD